VLINLSSGTAVIRPCQGSFPLVLRVVLTVVLTV
jgi:hypothetical protein